MSNWVLFHPNPFFSLLHTILWFVQRCLILNGTEWKCWRETDFKMKWRSEVNAGFHPVPAIIHLGNRGYWEQSQAEKEMCWQAFICVMMCRFPPAKSLRKGFSFQFSDTITYRKHSYYRKVDIFIRKGYT